MKWQEQRRQKDRESKKGKGKMTGGKTKWTQQQRRAITARGSDVLVTASAGTGKTAVLSGRCVDIVSNKDICPDVWSILVLTFTEMAAEQMRSRIAEQLQSAISASGDSHLRHQLILLQAADISTIHSFCKRLITEFFYKLGLDPTFRVIDSDEARLLKTEVLEKTINWAWEQSNLVQGLQQLLRRRDLRTNDGFLSKIIDLNDFLDGVISRDNWYERASALAAAVNPFTTELGKKQKQIAAEKLQRILNQIQYAQKLYESKDTGGNWARKWEESFVEPVSRCIKLLEAGNWGRCAEEIINFQKPSRFEYKPRELDGSIAEIIRKTAQNAKNSFEKLSDLAILNPDYLDKVGGAVNLQTRVLIELVKKFDQFYSRAKRAINCLDFADLEHYALKLLTEENSSGDKLLASETALALRTKYRYIFVDEYQDINPVQQAILDALSCEDNVFVVGDVKQSIYGFRGTDAGIFTKQLKSASVDSGSAGKGLRVDLTYNFRSKKGILDFVNKVFSKIMTASLADIDYDESANLRPWVETRMVSDSEHVVELHILDKESKEEISEKPYTARQCQAAMVARRITEMVGAETGKPEFQIYDKQTGDQRGVEYRDIVVLMRSLVKKANDYVEILRLAGVPVSCQGTAGYFEMTEISDMLSLLKVLDNPQRDIELASVLRNPFFKVSDTELAEIRVQSKSDEQEKNFYNCVVSYSESGPDVKLADKLKKTIGQLERWRTAARRGDLADLMWQIYRQTGFLSFVSALPNGQARRANLLKLHDRAIQFEGFASSSGIASLTRFVEFIEKLQEAGQDWASAEPEAEAANAVRIISIHKSKGLEFPVVFLAELDSGFNKRDLEADFLADAGDTLGLQIIDRRSNSKLSSLAQQVIAEQKLLTSLAEEMRILYVGTTRARERLILTACEKRKVCRDIICNGLLFSDGPIADWQLRQCGSALEWILYGLSDQKKLHKAFESDFAERAVDDDLFSIKVYDQTELKALSGYIFKLKNDKSSRFAPTVRKLHPKRTGSKELRQVRRSLGWRYGFGDAVLLPAKRSVTQLTHRNDEYVRIDYSRALERRPKAALSSESAETIDSRLIGGAGHLIIAQLDLGKPVTKEAIEKAEEKLLADGAIPEAVAEYINTESIMTFFESELGRAALDAGNIVWHEWPFTFAMPASEFNDSSHEWDPKRNKRRLAAQSQVTSDETIIVQGIIDMLVKTNDGLLVIDFKTDNITAGEIGERADLYRRQLELYSRAASAILKAEVLGRWLYFLTLSRAIEV